MNAEQAGSANREVSVRPVQTRIDVLMTMVIAGLISASAMLLPISADTRGDVILAGILYGGVVGDVIHYRRWGYGHLARGERVRLFLACTTLSAAVVVPSLVVLTDVMGAGIRVTLIPNARVLVLLMALSMAGLASQRCSHWLALNGRREHEAQERHDGRET